MLEEIIAYGLIGIFLGPVASVVITPIFCLLRKIFFVPFIREKLREEAENKGHVVQATLQKHHTITKESEFGPVGTMEEMGTYTYEVNGKKYKYRCVSFTGLHKTITLYYIKKPRKATVGGDLGNWESPWFKFYWIIALIVAVVTIIAGLTVPGVFDLKGVEH